MSSFQNGGDSSFTRNNGKERFYLQAGFEGCLCCRWASSAITEIPYTHESRHCIPVQNFSFWNECQSTGIFKDDEICSRTIAKGGNSFSILPGRYLPISSDQGRNAQSLYQSNYPLDIFRVHLKSREKYINSIAQTGLSGVYFQLNQYENYGACQENQQIGQSNQASSSTTNSFLQVVCKPNGKNGIHDSSNWGGALTHQILAEGPCSQLTTTSPEAGSTIHTLDQQQSRITMVDELCHRQEWTADTKDRQPKASNYDPRSQQRNIMALDLYDDVTIIELYTVAKNETEKHAGASESQLNALATICSTSENQFKKIRNLLKGELPANSKVLKYVNQDVDYHSKLKRKYEEIVFEDKDETTTPMEEPAEIKVIESVVQDSLTDEEITFIENFISKKNGKMSWKICWETGSRVGYFKRYGNGESLRVTYSRVRKNLK